MNWRPALFPIKLLQIALFFMTVVPSLDGRVLKHNEETLGSVGIVPIDEDGESLHFGPMSSDTHKNHDENASEMISVKLLNQFHMRSFESSEQPDDSGTLIADQRSAPMEPIYETVYQQQTNSEALDSVPHLPSASIEANVIDVKENAIEDNFIPIEPIIDKLLRESLRLSEGHSMSVDIGSAKGKQVTMVSEATHRPMLTTLLTTTTRTTTSTTTVHNVRRKSKATSRKPATTTSTTTTSSSTTQRSRPTTSKTTSRKPTAPRIDITKLNLEHLENELVPFPHFGSSQALVHAAASSSSSPSRLLPRSIRPPPSNVVPPTDAIPPCGCQHRKRSLPPSQYSSEDITDLAGDYDDYDYEYNDLRQGGSPSGKLHNKPMVFPVMSRLLAPASTEPLENSIERAEKVHGTLERLMGIVTIFSHVDEFIQRKTKQSIKRLARLYESEEEY